MTTISGTTKDSSGSFVARRIRACRLDSGALIGEASSAAADAIEGDEYFTNVVLLLHGEGANNSTSVTDSSNAAASITCNGAACIKTAQKKFGSSSLYFDGSASYLTAPDVSEYDFGSGDFTIDLQVYWESVGASCFLQQSDGTSGYVLKWTLYYASGSLYLAGHNPSGSPLTWISASWTPSAGTWYHIALTRSGNSFRFFVNGTQVGSTTTNSTALPNSNGALHIGRFYDEPISSNGNHNGYMDEIRITKGVARYTSNFTAPTAQFPDSEYVTANELGRYYINCGSYTDDVIVYEFDPSDLTIRPQIHFSTPV